MQVDIFTQQKSSIDQLIATLIQLESRPKLAIVDQKSVLTRKDAVLSDLDSKLSSLESLVKRLTDSITDYFAAKSASGSDDKLFTVSAGTSAQVASHDLTVQRLAKSDTRVSKQYTATGSDLQSFFSSNGSQTFQIQVAHPTTSDSSNRVNVSVTVNPSTTSNDDILKDIATAINSAMDSAVSASTITSDEKVTASVVQEQSGKSRLIFRSATSGYTYRMGFTDSANSLLSSLEISNNVQTSGTSGGYVTSIGTSATDSQLNAKLQLDGLTFYRDKNEITDIQTGVTLTLKNVTTSTETIKISIDVSAVKTEVEKFLTAYNDALKFLKAKTTVDPDTYVREVLAGDSTYRGLLASLRSIISSKVTNVVTGNPQYLSEIGITAGDDGSLSITDSEKFEQKLQSSSKTISDLFNATDGIATQIKNLIADYVKVGGVIDDSQTSLSDRLKVLDNRIERMDDRLVEREQQLRKQFARMQQVAALLQRQQFTFQSIFPGA
ncbi:MAG: flagellar filament capping protein FliD [bacterium]